MSRLILLCCCLLTTLLFAGCAKSGATADEKKAALAAAEEIARNDPDVGGEIIDLTEAHGKMIVIIKDGVHPMKQASFLQNIAMGWFNAYPDGHKPTVNDMIQVWLYVTDKSEDEVGFMKVYADEYGKMSADFHHYKTQQAM